jgi:multimeric flavodoxin WrbA
MLTSEYGQRIFPYKGCVSTAMPLCHWPCSCYPNHSLDQVGDVMNVIYPRWIAADGIILITPVY